MIKKIIWAVFFLLCICSEAYSQIFTINVSLTQNPANDPHSAYEGELKYYRVSVTLNGTLPSSYKFVAAVTNGTVTQEYLVPSFPPSQPVQLFVEVQWDCNQTIGTIEVKEKNTGISTLYTTTILSYLNDPLYCKTVSPLKQNLHYNQTPANITVTNCIPACHPSPSYQYQWEVGDVPIGVFPQVPTTWTNVQYPTINPPDPVSYQPPTYNVDCIKAYRRITKVNGTTVSISDIAIVSTFDYLNGGTITWNNTFNNGVPGISNTAATGGLCDGFHYSYTWEFSVDNTNWTQPASGQHYPVTLQIPGPITIRRKVDCNGEFAYSNAINIYPAPLIAGTITNTGASTLAFNTVPSITQTSASGSACNAPEYIYTWERSINNGPWLTFGVSGISYQNYPAAYGIISTCKIRRKVHCIYEDAYSNELPFTMLPYTSPNTENFNYVRVNNIVIPNVHSWEQADALPTGEKLQTTTYLDAVGRPIQEIIKQGSLKPTSSPDELYVNSIANYQDLVTHIAYDGLGRADKDYLPYATSTNLGFYKNNAEQDQQSFTNQKYGEPGGSVYTYAQTIYENSPSNRETNIKLPGAALNNDPNYLGISSEYDFNLHSEDIKVWSIGFNSNDKPYVDYSFYTDGKYPSNKLTKSITRDEKGKLIITYTDFKGSTILKRVQLDNNAINPPTGDGGAWVSTYYVFDDLGRLRYTISPKAVDLMAQANNWIIDDDLKNGLCFYQEYDKKGRIIVKHSPDGGETWLVYDNRDRLVLSQDENQRHRNGTPGKQNQWAYSLYDENDRTLVTGLIDESRNRLQMQAFVDGIFSSNYGGNQPVEIYTGTWETVTAYNPVAGKINGGGYYCQPCTQSYVNTVSYYDNYTKSPLSQKAVNLVINDFPSQTSPYVEAPEVSYTRIRGLLTVSKIRVLDDKYDNGNLTDEKFLCNTTYYDKKGRVIQTSVDNYNGVVNGTDLSAILYDYAGKALGTRGKHGMPNNDFDNLLVFTKTKYDLLGNGFELMKLYTKISSDAGIDSKYKKLSNTWLDEFGRVKLRTIGEDLLNGGPLETQDFTYNIQGVLTGMNKDYALASGMTMSSQWQRHFGYYLGYENADGSFAAKQYNGSITGVIWRSQGDNAQRKFDYEYDNLNRFRKANFTQKDNPTVNTGYINSKIDFTTTISGYDHNGNIQGMKHMGIVPGTNGGIVLDDLLYDYNNYNNGKTNKLGKVQDFASSNYSGKQGDFKDFAAAKDYDYDYNGNLKYDKNKNILDVNSNQTDPSPNAGIISNFLNLPESITVKDKSRTEYIFDAAGSKLGKKVINLAVTPNTITTTWFIGGFVYEEANATTTLQCILNEEGKLRIIEPYGPAIAPGSAGVFALTLGGNLNLGVNNKWGVWDYYIKDNLGNTRMVLTEEIHEQKMKCSMESSNPSNPLQLEEEREFGSQQANEVTATRIDKSQTNWASNPSNQVAKLINTPGKSVGPNAILKVMAGDQISAKVDYYYDYASSAGNSSVLTNVVNSLLGILGGSNVISGGIKDNIATTIPTLAGNNIFTFMQNEQPASPGSTTPRAYLNIVFFDEQFRFISNGSTAEKVQDITGGSIQNDLKKIQIKAPQNGYVFIYVSNESQSIPVLFDDLIITHERGAIVEDNAYYPFGLKIQGISSRAAGKLITKEGYQGNYSQHDEETGYGEFALRFYDAQIGRWIQVDPHDVEGGMYNAMVNNPVSFNDPTGGAPPGLWGRMINKKNKSLYDYRFFKNGTLGKGFSIVPEGELFLNASNYGCILLSQTGYIIKMRNTLLPNSMSTFTPSFEDKLRFLTNTTGDGRLAVAVGALKSAWETAKGIVVLASLQQGRFASGALGDAQREMIHGVDQLMYQTSISGTNNVGAVILANYVGSAYDDYANGDFYDASTRTGKIGFDVLSLWGGGEIGIATKAKVGVEIAEVAAKGGGSSFYRAMSNTEFAALESSGGLTHMPGKELFVSTEVSYSSAYLKKPGYDVLVKFEMKPGAMDYFNQVAVKHRTAAGASGWAERGNLMWKREQGVMNLGIQQNTHMFNPWIQSFKPFP